MDKDCYFFIDESVPEEKRKISVLCVECHDTKMPKTGMFYEGSKEGYGPFDYKCCVCGTLVNECDEYDEEDQAAD
jgi:hypothetical protein